MRGVRQPWTEKELRFVLDNYKKLNKRQLEEELKKMGSIHNRNSIKALFTKYGLVSGIESKFKKGNVPATKGVKLTPEQYAKCSKTFFKKGLRPHNTLEVGDEVVTDYGYIKVKVAEPNKWEFKHHLEWKKHKGPVPKGYKITFLDGNKLNCDISNLTIITALIMLAISILLSVLSGLIPSMKASHQDPVIALRSGE